MIIQWHYLFQNRNYKTPEIKLLFPQDTLIKIISSPRKVLENFYNGRCTAEINYCNQSTNEGIMVKFTPSHRAVCRHYRAESEKLGKPVLLLISMNARDPAGVLNPIGSGIIPIRGKFLQRRKISRWSAFRSINHASKRVNFTRQSDASKRSICHRSLRCPLVSLIAQWIDVKSYN